MKKILVAVAALMMVSTIAFAAGEGDAGEGNTGEFGGGPTDGGRVPKDDGCRYTGGGQEGGIYEDGGPNCRPEGTPITEHPGTVRDFVIFETRELANLHCHVSTSIVPVWGLANGSMQLKGYACMASNEPGSGGR